MECRIAVDTGGASEHKVIAYVHLSHWNWNRAGLVGGLQEGNSRQSEE